MRPIKADPQVARSALVVEGFHGIFNRLIEINEDYPTKGPSLITRFQRLGSAYREKRAQLHFYSYLNENNQDFFNHPETHELLYWLEKSESPWEISTSPDDFINKPNAWPRSKNILFYEGGGHLFGFLMRPGFRKRFNDFFPKL